MEAVAINKTPNLNLQKPTSDELYSVQVQNSNMDILDSTIKTMQNTDATLAKQTDLESHINNKDNPHAVTKEQIGLSNVVNQRQIPAVQTTVTDNGIPVFNGNGNSLKDSGFTIGKSVPEDAIFTDTVYTHPISGVIPNTYKSVTVDERGHVVDGTNPTTLSGYGITDAEPLGSVDTALLDAKEYADNTYTQATGYTDIKISELINGAPSTLDTLKEIADAMEENQDVVDALETAIGDKADEVEFQAHKNNNTVHVTASQTEKWDDYETDISTLNSKLTPTNISTAFTYPATISDFTATKTGNKVRVNFLVSDSSTTKSDITITLPTGYSAKFSVRDAALNYGAWGNKEYQCHISIVVTGNTLVIGNSAAPYGYIRVNVEYEI